MEAKNMHLISTYGLRSLLLAVGSLLTCGVCFSEPTAITGWEDDVTFIEVRVDATGHAAAVLRQQANAGRSRDWQIMALQEISRPERFVTLERLTAQLVGGLFIPPDLAKGLTEDLIAPPDVRPNIVFYEAANKTGAQANTRASFYVITHVDVTTPDRTQVEAALRKLAAAADRSDGNLGFLVLQQSPAHPNHYNLVSAWLSESSFHSFAAGADAREFRKLVGPSLGAPYDERLYRRID
jgi:heme-degrading monooxygenase HmoA